MVDTFVNVVIGFLSGAVGSLGIGGGGILIVMLTLALGIKQNNATLANLIFFIPVAIFSLILYSRQGKVKWKTTTFLALFGVIGAVVGVLLSGIIGANIIRKIFAVLLIIISTAELLKKDEIH